jgi:hypothetical protein
MQKSHAPDSKVPVSVFAPCPCSMSAQQQLLDGELTAPAHIPGRERGSTTALARPDVKVAALPACTIALGRSVSVRNTTEPARTGVRASARGATEPVHIRASDAHRVCEWYCRASQAEAAKVGVSESGSVPVCDLAPPVSFEPPHLNVHPSAACASNILPLPLPGSSQGLRPQESLLKGSGALPTDVDVEVPLTAALQTVRAWLGSLTQQSQVALANGHAPLCAHDLRAATELLGFASDAVSAVVTNTQEHSQHSAVTENCVPPQLPHHLQDFGIAVAANSSCTPQASDLEVRSVRRPSLVCEEPVAPALSPAACTRELRTHKRTNATADANNAPSCESSSTARGGNLPIDPLLCIQYRYAAAPTIPPAPSPACARSGSPAVAGVPTVPVAGPRLELQRRPAANPLPDISKHPPAFPAPSPLVQLPGPAGNGRALANKPHAAANSGGQPAPAADHPEHRTTTTPTLEAVARADRLSALAKPTGISIGFFLFSVCLNSLLFDARGPPTLHQLGCRAWRKKNGFKNDLSVVFCRQERSSCSVHSSSCLRLGHGA